MFKYLAALALLITGCGGGMEYAFISQPVPTAPQYAIGEVVYVRGIFCRGRIVSRTNDIYIINPVFCADGLVFYNVMVNSYEISR